MLVICKNFTLGGLENFLPWGGWPFRGQAPKSREGLRFYQIFPFYVSYWLSWQHWLYLQCMHTNRRSAVKLEPNLCVQFTIKLLIHSQYFPKRWMARKYWWELTIFFLQCKGDPVRNYAHCKKPAKFSQTAKKLSSGFGLHAFFKNVLYKNVEAEICRKFKNVQGS